MSEEKQNKNVVNFMGRRLVFTDALFSLLWADLWDHSLTTTATHLSFITSWVAPFVLSGTSWVQAGVLLCHSPTNESKVQWLSGRKSHYPPLKQQRVQKIYKMSRAKWLNCCISNINLSTQTAIRQNSPNIKKEPSKWGEKTIISD